jgi:class 3 adenylate cyclase/CHASE2 domain-containing sensor protein
MTRFERHLLFDTILLGIALTLLTVLVDRVGWLNYLETFFNDERAAHFQFFRPPPSDQIEYVDIDDGTIDAIGHWPWPREKLASIIDEMNLAGVKVVDLDIILSEAQEPTVLPGEPVMDNDALLAKSLDRLRSQAGRGALVPLSVNINETDESDPVYQAIVTLLRGDLELEENELVQHLRNAGNTDEKLPGVVDDHYRPALAAAMFDRVKDALDHGRAPDPQLLRSILLPRSEVSGFVSDAVRVLDKTIPLVQSHEALLKFTRPEQPGLPPLLSRREEQTVPITPFAQAAAFSGFVDMWDYGNTKVRNIPLWISDRDRMIPQMGLALACAHLGVSTNDLILAPDSVTIPCPDGRRIVIPVSTVHAGGRDVGMIMDIPWFGGNAWQTMYDWPAHRLPLQHMPMKNIWDICSIEQEIEDNNRGAVDAVRNLAHKASPETLDRVLNHAPSFDQPEAWNRMIKDTLDDLPPGFLDDDSYRDYLAGKASIDSVTDPQLHELALDIHKAMLTPKVNDELLKQRVDLRQQLRKELSGKSVLVGMIDTGGTDFRTTPLHQQCPGVVVHGVITSAILTGDFLHRTPGWVSMLLTIFVGFLVTTVSAYFPGSKALALTAVIVVAFILLDCLVAYDWWRMEIPAAGPPTAAALIWTTCTLTHFVREKRERGRITSRLSSYVDPSLVNYVLDHPEKATLAGEDRELSVVFTDLAGFTTISETLKEQTVGLLNEYLGLMVPVITKHHGLVNKFLGDGIMFFFGAPEPYPGDPELHAWAAVRTVVEMQQVMTSFNASLMQRKLPTLKMRAGVSSGDMVVGDAGNPPQRSDYTVLGDRVNFASRLESANKYTGTLILLSDRTVALLKGSYLVRPIGRLQVVGKNEPVMTYEPLAPIEQATDEMRKLVDMTLAVTDNFAAARFAECAAATRALLAVYGEAAQGKFCELYQRLCVEYLENPPQEFMGQIKLESK